MRLISILPALILCCTSPAWGAPLLTLGEALRTALENHPRLVEARENLNGAEAVTGQALANYYPRLSIEADWSRGRSFLLQTETTRDTEVHADTLQLRQTIYDFGRTAGAVEAARGNRAAAGQSLAATRQDLALRVRSAYYLLLAAGKWVATTRETVDAREKVYLQAEAFFREGVRARVDVARAEANLYTARTALIRAENNREIAQVELATAMGLPSLEGRSPVEPVHLDAGLPELGPIRQRALADRPELKRLAALKNSSAAALKAARSGHLPILSATASIGYAGSGFPPDGNVWGVGVNLTVPIFSGFSTVEKEKEAAATLRATEARYDNERLQVIREVESAWFGVREALARISSTGKEQAAAGEGRTLAEGRYREGVGSIIEVTDAQSQSLDAETAHIPAVLEYRIALARLDWAMGREQ